MQLETPVTKLPLVGPVYARRLKKLDIETIGELLLHVPHRYLDFRLVSKIAHVQVGETVTVRGEMVSMRNQYTRSGKKIQIAEIAGNSGKIKAVWFNQPFLVKTLSPGTQVSLAGKVDWFARFPAFISPEYEKVGQAGKGVHTGRLIPIYPETAGISSKWLRARIVDAYEKTKLNIREYLPESVLIKYNLENLDEAISKVHFPKNYQDADNGKLRLAFNELLLLHLRSLYRKIEWQKNEVAYKLSVDKNAIDKFVASLPFQLTSSQKRSITEILKDLKKSVPMNRLLEGDVGSGKTVVAASAAFVAFLNGYQTVIMAPTQILAQQHFNTLKTLFDKFKVRVSLVTSAAVIADLGKSDIFVGTHALIHKRVSFDKVAVVVIDEQHRFGVEQRAHLVTETKSRRSSPHVLTMTATPIPRTIALTFYGDLDLSTLDELPSGRKPVKTWLVPPQKRESAYNWIEKQVVEKSAQVFVICPLIEESEKETMQQVKAATKEFENLKKVFANLNLGLLHGKQSAKEKNKAVLEFKKGKIDILVATPVVEVGIDVPNATIMLIETAERFGLAQLHQLRGRVGRSDKQSFCLLFTEIDSPRPHTRLAAMQKTMSGFELAELDLRLRGPGEVFGTRQHGFPELKIASWQDIKLIKQSRKVAQKAIANPNNFPQLLKMLKKKQHVAN